MSAQKEKIALFIDGANLYATAKSLGFDIDYKRLLREFQSRGYLVRAFYYTAVIEDQEYSSIRPLIDWLDYNGYTVVTKATKEFVDQTGRRKVKGNMDIELAVDAMELAPHIDQMVLFSGDGDFRSLVEAVQRTRRARRSWSRPSRRSRRWLPTNCAARPTSSSISSTCNPKSAAIRANGRCANRGNRAKPREPRHTPQFLQRSPTSQRVEVEETSSKTNSSGRAVCRRCHARRAACPAAIVRAVRVWLPFASPGASASRTGSTPRSIRSDRFDARLLIVGLAPGLRGANRTGRPFTGDYAGDLLYAHAYAIRLCPRAITKHAPDDSLELVDCRITNAVRCVPPENKPTPAEIATCRDFLAATVKEMPRLAAVLALGRIAHETVVVSSGARRSEFPFGHGRTHTLGALTLFDSYHCSRYNTNTGVLTPQMFRDVIARARNALDAQKT